MKVAALIEKLQKMPQHFDVCINDNGGETFYNHIDNVFEVAEDEVEGNEECVIIEINSL